MGFRFRKSVKIAPGVRVNLGKKSSSVSFGGKGVSHTVSSTGRRTTSVGIPGTGVSYSTTHGSTKTTGSSQGSPRGGGTITCRNCGAELSKTAKVCRYCRTKVKRPVRVKWWVWVLVLLLLGSCGRACTGQKEQPSDVDGNEVVVSEAVPEVAEPERVEDTKEPSEDPKPIIEEPPVEEVPIVVAPVVEDVPEQQPTVEETPVEEEPIGNTYVLNTSSMKFHYPSCGSVNKIKDHNKGSHTGTRDELISWGYKPCGNCHP